MNSENKLDSRGESDIWKFPVYCFRKDEINKWKNNVPKLNVRGSA